MIALMVLAAIAQTPCKNWIGYDADHHRAICGPSPPEAPPRPRLLDVEAELDPYVSGAIESYVVSLCGLRSTAWSALIRSKVSDIIQQKAHRLTSADLARLDAWQEAEADKIQTHMLPGGLSVRNCRRLTNTPLLTELDELGIRLRGNFR